MLFFNLTFLFLLIFSSNWQTSQGFTGAQCDITKNPFICIPENNCVQSPLQCAPNIFCPPEQPYLCADKVCRDSPVACKQIVNPSCNESNQCWDGYCVTNVTRECSKMPRCPPQYPKRCWNSICWPVDHDCGNQNPCGSKFQCPDGNCVLSDDLCTFYDGCDVAGLNIQCPDGSCANSSDDCKCSNGKYHCWNGDCVDDPESCGEPPWFPVPVHYNFKISTDMDNFIPVYTVSNNSTQMTCSAFVPAGTFQAPDDWTIIYVNSLADSYLTDHFNLSILVSIGFQLSVPPNVPQPFANDITLTCRVQLPPQLSAIENPSGSLCLGYIDYAAMDWKCQDESTTVLQDKDGSFIVSGKTNHWTTFCVLLINSQASIKPQASDSDSSQNISGVSIGFIAAISVVVAALVVSSGCVIIILYRNKIKREEEKYLGAKRATIDQQMENSVTIFNPSVDEPSLLFKKGIIELKA